MLLLTVPTVHIKDVQFMTHFFVILSKVNLDEHKQESAVLVLTA